MVSFTSIILATGLASSIAAAPLAMVAVSVASTFIHKRDGGLAPGEFSFLEDRAAAVQGQPQGNPMASKTGSVPAATGGAAAPGTAKPNTSVQAQFKDCVATMKKNKPDVKKFAGNVVTISKLSNDCVKIIKAYNTRPDIEILEGKQGTATFISNAAVVLHNMPADVVDALDG